MDSTIEQQELHAQFLTAEDHHIAASLLYQAYHDDELYQDFFNYKDDNKIDYEKKLRAVIREELACFWQTRQPMIGVYVDGQLKGVACINVLQSGLNAERLWHWRLKMQLQAGRISTKQLIEKEQRVQEALKAREATGLISLIAVDPHCQQQGVGRFLLRAIDDGAKQSGCKGVSLLLTRDKYSKLFKEEGYDDIGSLQFSQINAHLLYKQLG